MDELAELASNIKREVQALQSLEKEIEEEDALDLPRGGASATESREKVVESRSKICLPRAFTGKQPRLSTRETLIEVNSHPARWWESEGVPTEQDTSLHTSRETYKVLKKHKRAKSAQDQAFSLHAVAQQMAQMVNIEKQDRLELPPWRSRHRKQAAAVAALFGLEAHSCGRVEQTFFRTASTAPLGPQGEEQLARLLICSAGHAPTDAEVEQQQQREQAARQSQRAADRVTASGKRSKKPKQLGAQAERGAAAPLEAASRAALLVPLAADNRGRKLLESAGWSEGQGLGAQGQGTLEPVAVTKRRKRQGLGAE